MCRESLVHWIALSILLIFTTAWTPASGSEATLRPGFAPIAEFRGAVRIELNGALGRHGTLQWPPERPHGYMVTVTNWEGRHRLSLHVDVLDWRGHAVANRRVQIAAEPGETGFELFFDTDLAPGWYRLAYEVLDATERHVTAGRRDFVVLAQRDSSPDPDSRFGMMNAQLQPYEAELLRDLGVGLLLGAGVPKWEDVQFRADGAFVWRAQADEAEAAARSGLRLTGRVGGPPLWASTRLFHSGVGLGEAAEQSHVAHQASPITDLAAYFGFVDGLVSRFGAQLPYVSTREPTNRPGVYLGSMQELASEMKSTATALSMSGPAKPKHVVEIDGFDLAYLAALFEQGVAWTADALLIHLPSRLAGEPEALDQHPDWRAIRNLLHRYAAGTRIWTYTPHYSVFESTELGGGSMPRSAEAGVPAVVRLLRQPTPSGTDAYPKASEAERLQAAYLIRHHLIQWANGVDRVFSGPFSSGESSRRLFSGGAGAYPDVPQRPRLAMAAYATLTNQLAEHTYIGRLQTPPDVWAFVFANGGKPLLVAWTSRERAVLELNVLVTQAEVRNMLGDPSHVEMADGRLVLPLGPEPQYIHGLDAGLLSRAVADEAIATVLEIAELVPAIRDRLVRLNARIERIATELWFWAAAERIAAAGQPGVLPGALGSGTMGPGLRPQADLDLVESEWRATVAELFGIIEELGHEADPGPRAHAAVHRLLDLVPALVQVILATGRQWIAASPQDVLFGTEALLQEAQAVVRQRPLQSIHANRVLDRAEEWFRRAQSGATEEVPAWALVAREAAAQAVLQHSRGEVRRSGLWLRAAAGALSGPIEPVWDVGVIGVAEPRPGDRRAGLASPDPTQLLQTAVRPAQLPLRWLDSQERQLQPDFDRYAFEAPRWLRLAVPVSVLNASGAEVEVHLGLIGPHGWLWEFGGHALSSHTWMEQTRASAAGTPGRAMEQPLALHLLVPVDARPGTYDLTVVLFTPEGEVDRITFRLDIPIDPAELSGV